MDIKQLEYFVRIAELGSFSRASSCLQIAQPALSRQIANLESELKDKLLVRNGRGVETTEAGERLLTHARNVLHLVAKTYEDIDNARKGKAGKVTIGMPSTMSTALAAPLIRQLRDELSDAQVSVVHGCSNRLQEWLLAGQVDIAVMFNTPNSPMLEVYHLADETLYLFGAPKILKTERPATLQQLTELPMIVGSRSNSIRSLLEAELARYGQTLNILFELDAFEPSFELARDGFGCTVAPLRTLYAKGGGLHGLLARRFVGAGLTLSVELVLPARRSRNQLHEATFGVIQNLGRRLLQEQETCQAAE